MIYTFRSVTPTELGVDYWAHTARRVIPLRECTECGLRRLYLTNVCSRCHGTQWTWTEAAGLGTVYASTIVRVRLSAEFPSSYQVALIDLDEGVRMMANIVVDDEQPLPIGTRVRAVFEELPDGKQLPQFSTLD